MNTEKEQKEIEEKWQTERLEKQINFIREMDKEKFIGRQKAAERLYGLLPEDQGAKLKAIWEEFETKNTPESRFAHTMDNLQPVILNAATDGKAWKEHQVRLSQFMGRQEDTPKGSETLWRYEWEKLVKPFLENGTIRVDE